MADISTWSGQDIINWLLRYPTPEKAVTGGADVVDTYWRAACSDTGRWFLPIHAENRLKAGDQREYDSIMNVMAKCDQIVATVPTPQPAPVAVVFPTAPLVQPQQPVQPVPVQAVQAIMPSMTPGPVGSVAPPAVYNITETPQDYSGLFPGQAAPSQSPNIWLLAAVGVGIYLLFGR